MKQSKLRTLVFSAAVAALVAVATLFLHVPIPMEAGYCNLGDGVILASGALLGPWAAAAAALGSALADLLLGYMAYAPVTAVIKGAMGLMAGTLYLRAKKAWLRIGWMALAEILMVGGYFLFECALYGAGAAAGSLPGNLFQGAAGLLVGAALWPLIQRTTRLLK